ncbi:hypothetical protein BDV98DRAFT_5111 [Pterulicium gracile]|uniref:Enoyl reductase (ER) domain-containing protein n=1 Tax=Pterulicium gracile TaxID=1884261 RepID=A0A5C3QY77_9AGAR|nr:hypothetical protein BDV98DRAFT_5111 [Pterula gracilis]
MFRPRSQQRKPTNPPLAQQPPCFRQRLQSIYSRTSTESTLRKVLSLWQTSKAPPEPPKPLTSRRWRATQGKDTLKRQLILEEEIVPTLEPAQVLVKVHAVSLNFTEVLILEGKFHAIPRVIPCSDMAGEVVAVGEEVSTVSVGDRVSAGRLLDFVEGTLGRTDYHHSGTGIYVDGMLDEYKVLPVESLVVIPEHLSYEEASTLPCVAITAYNCLFGGPKQVEKGDTLLLIGTGNLSLFAAQFASAVGVNVIFTTSSDEKVSQLKDMGFTQFVNYKTNPDWDKEVMDLTGGVGASHIIETGGMGTLGKSISCVAMGGWIHAVGFLSEQPNNIDLTFEAIMKNCIIRGVFVGPNTLFNEMNEFISEKKLRPLVDKIFGFDEVPQAFEYLSSRRSMGKVVIRMPCVERV